jgi:hypothetical protein
VGDDERGTWLVPLGPGGCLSVLGPAAKELVEAMTLVAEGWDWSDHIEVTDNCHVVRGRLGCLPARDPVLFVGDMAALDDQSRETCAVLTTSATEHADLTLVVDTLTVTVHPLGLTFRPHRVSSDLNEPLKHLVARGIPEPLVTEVGATRPDSPSLKGAADVPDTRQSTVQVRLLTPMPRIEGLIEALPNKRARRAIELVAYLALHRPHPVTSDRLRTRVLGNADVDAAAKTLFNTAAAARRSLGANEDGEPLLPLAGRSGHYRVEGGVHVDVLEVEHLVYRAGAETDLTTQIDLLRRALALVEGEPMAAVTGGYEWWLAEGHAARVAGVLVDAACHLANLATSAGLPALAAWGISQARFVERYSEALSRAAMRAAAASGDADRLRREWQDCCRQIDELDPGAMPSEETELLYSRLARRDYASLPAMEPAPRNTVPSAPTAL